MIHAFMDGMLSFCQCKSDESRQKLLTGPLMWLTHGDPSVGRGAAGFEKSRGGAGIAD